MIARAGVGLDNVDVKSATTAGVMVVNAPTSNIVSAAELAIGHLLALARHIPDANQSAKAGEWKRSKFTGTELFEQDRRHHRPRPHRHPGRAPARRLRRQLLAYDPYVTPTRAQQLGVQLATLDELVEQSDFITIHIPKTPRRSA